MDCFAGCFSFLRGDGGATGSAEGAKECGATFPAIRQHSMTIEGYLARIEKYFGCSEECYVIALIYIERMLRGGRLDLDGFHLSVHRLVLVAVMVAVKLHHDDFCDNKYYARVGGLALAELNTLEKKFMGLIDWRVHVSGQQFELYKDFGFSLKSYIKMNLLTESAPMTTHVPKRKSSSSPRARNADAKRRRKSSSPSALSTLHPFYLMIPQQFIFLEVRF